MITQKTEESVLLGVRLRMDDKWFTKELSSGLSADKDGIAASLVSEHCAEVCSSRVSQ